MIERINHATQQTSSLKGMRKEGAPLSVTFCRSATSAPQKYTPAPRRSQLRTSQSTSVASVSLQAQGSTTTTLVKTQWVESRRTARCRHAVYETLIVLTTPRNFYQGSTLSVGRMIESGRRTAIVTPAAAQRALSGRCAAALRRSRSSDLLRSGYPSRA
jgi:hypothetical protein